MRPENPIPAIALPSPRTNRRLHGFEVDFAAFERDRERDASLVAAGYAVVRITWRQLVDRPEAVVARIASALATR